MQEDKWSTQLGKRLRNLQEEAPQPYLPGSWEAFEARRNQKQSIPLVWWWAGGIAASLALIFLVGGLWTGEQQEKSSGKQLVLETQVSQKESAALPAQSEGNPETPANGGEAPANFSKQPNKKQSDKDRKLLPTTEQGFDPLVARIAISSEEPVRIVESASGASAQPTTAASSTQVAAIASLGEEKVSAPTNPAVPSFTEIIPSEAEALLAAQKDPLAFAVGLGPGFGNSSEANQITSGSRIGLGMQIDMALAGKLRIGSGLGVNYLSQASEGQTSLKLVGVNSPIQESTQVQQVQVDLPLYVRYSVTPSKSISVQAGFSNLLTFNQEAQQELTYTRQVAAPADATSNSLSSLKSTQVVETSPLAGPSSRFLPFAQANLGVNVRVYETKKSTYLLMPFYSYPLVDISGTGQNPAVLGAAVKITFGTLKK
jgi:hypothetical protein